MGQLGPAPGQCGDSKAWLLAPQSWGLHHQLNKPSAQTLGKETGTSHRVRVPRVEPVWSNSCLPRAARVVSAPEEQPPEVTALS